MCTLILHTWHIFTDRRNRTISSPWHHLGFLCSYFLPGCLKLNSASVFLLFFSTPFSWSSLLGLRFLPNITFQAFTFVTHFSSAVKLRRCFFPLLLFSFCSKCTAITTGYELSCTVIDVFNFLSFSRSLFPSLWPDKRDIHTLIVYVCFTQHS